MANSYKNRFSLLGTYNAVPQKLPPFKVNHVGTDTLGNSEFLLSKTYFKLLQSIHHTEILSEALDTGVPPLGMAKKVTSLTAFIKPAAPDDMVLTEIKNNTIDWLNNNLRILTKHYGRIQKDLPLTLSPFSEEALNRALRWARQRYGRRLTPSSITTLRSLLTGPIAVLPPPATPLLISDKTAFPSLPTRPLTASFPFKHHNTLILPSRPLPIPSLLSLPPFSLGLTRRLPPTFTATPAPQPPRKSHPPLPQRLPVVRPRPPLTILPVRTTLTDTIPPISIDHTSVTLPKSLTPGPEPPITSLTCSTPRPSRLFHRKNPVQGQPRPLTFPPVSIPSPPSLTEEIALSVTKQTSTNQCTKKPTLTDTIPPIFIDHTSVTLPKSLTPGPEPPITSLTCSTPRPSRLFHRKNPVQGQPRPLTFPPVSIPSPPSLTEEIALSVIKQTSTDQCTKKQPNLLTFTAEIHPYPPSPPLVPPTGGVFITTGEKETITSSQQAASFLPNASSSSSPSSSLSPPLRLPSPSESSSDDPSGSPSRYQPRLHLHTNRKASTWSLPIRQPVIIMGDSNIARIPKFKLNGIQADSYPGATLRHLTAILLRLTSPRPDIKLILFSIGINNCLREQTALTIIKDTRRLVRLAREKFPQARIVIPLLTVSIRLSANQLLCVKAFNSFIRDNIENVDSRSGYLNQLSLLHFQTTHDNIHWTPETARLMMKDWLIQLDL